LLRAVGGKPEVTSEITASMASGFLRQKGVRLLLRLRRAESGSESPVWDIYPRAEVTVEHLIRDARSRDSGSDRECRD
jgi:hypothetical protein